MTVQITVLGIVQGIGYRPFVARLAEEMQIKGNVKNSGGIVEIVAVASKEAIDNFVHRLELHSPKGSRIDKILTREVPDQQFEEFGIIQSAPSTNETPLLPPDLPLCEDCKRELLDPNNRRYQYPFISCVACGPRYSIIESIPYDRENITMNCYEMCEPCEKEYRQENNRRRHAQTISCHNCGPQLILQLDNQTYHKEDALAKAISLLKQGNVLAIKGIGGYQFACLPTSRIAVEQLRLLKHRDKKPFAVMFPNLKTLKQHCKVSEEETLLTSSAYPIVLLQKKNDPFCPEVSGESRFIGAMLAYTPLHQLLTDACGPLVMTSGNLTSEPIITEDESMLALCTSPYLDGVLYNTRRIVTPLDDSVARIICGRPQLIRRSKGYIPHPIFLNQITKTPILAMGGDLKSCFCLTHNDRAYLSQYFGDMENYQISKAYHKALTHMEQIFAITPKLIVSDLHPGYHTTKLAEKLASSSNSKLIKIQHHHAHAATVMAEHGLSSCIGVVFDGTGYGTDGTVWGGEFLLCNNASYERLAHLHYVPLCGGDAAAKNAQQTAYCYLNAAGKTIENADFPTIQSAIKNNINTGESSSMGRLFDAVSAILEIKQTNTYEGECAITLENIAAAHEAQGKQPYPLQFKINYIQNKATANQADIIKTIYNAYQNGIDKAALALGFHKAVAEMVLEICIKIRADSGENQIALSGGVFANFLLTTDCVTLLEAANFKVYLNSQVPTNDGGISLGQAWLAAQIQV